jgi:hypothetical protein
MARPESARRRRRTGPAPVLAISLAVAAILWTAIYLVGTSLPYLMGSPASDPRFGELNQCLIAALREPRVGFAVSPDGARAAAYGSNGVALCARALAGEGRAFSLPGITAATFDFDGTLWLAATREARAQLWILGLRQEALQQVQGFAPVAVAGHARGVAALEGEGRLVSVSSRGAVLGMAELPAGAAGGAQLASNASGQLLSVALGGGLLLYRVDDLSRLRAEAPCEVEFVWWRQDPARAILSCGPGASWALELNVSTGEREAVPRPGVRSTLVPRLGAYVQSCDNLPCTAPSP